MGIKLIQERIVEFHCDNCKLKTDCDTITIHFGYPSKFDEEQLLFCSDKCLYMWVLKNKDKLGKEE